MEWAKNLHYEVVVILGGEKPDAFERMKFNKKPDADSGVNVETGSGLKCLPPQQCDHHIERTKDAEAQKRIDDIINDIARLIQSSWPEATHLRIGIARTTLVGDHNDRYVASAQAYRLLPADRKDPNGAYRIIAENNWKLYHRHTRLLGDGEPSVNCWEALSRLYAKLKPSTISGGADKTVSEAAMPAKSDLSEP